MKFWTIKCTIPPSEIIQPTMNTIAVLWRHAGGFQSSILQSLYIAQHGFLSIPGAGTSYVQASDTLVVAFPVRSNITPDRFFIVRP